MVIIDEITKPWLCCVHGLSAFSSFHLSFFLHNNCYNPDGFCRHFTATKSPTPKQALLKRNSLETGRNQQEEKNMSHTCKYILQGISFTYFINIVHKICKLFKLINFHDKQFKTFNNFGTIYEYIYIWILCLDCARIDFRGSHKTIILLLGNVWKKSVLWSALTETATETSVVNLNTAVDGGEELWFPTLVNTCISTEASLACMWISYQSFGSALKSKEKHELLSPVWILNIF